ncbi:gliding motility-associated-like protein [Kordia periserrulae]|uniref:Gliding motility-associated-like protein n=1 Tax=Kordia periserrulae TaxID=701523 RepID=A0A2T6BRP9_9FLAO|nr:T9SS type B sorting domain-containing protein [Kordia periserrulae]PTX58761.1 gliding motility-associated-like protein [Kordia periserrulae]
MRTFSTYILCVILLLLVANVRAQTPPTITATGDQQYCGDAPMNIATSVSITDPDAGDNTLPIVYIQISEGYSNGQDLLSLTGTHANINAFWTPDLGRLALVGPATFAEYEAAIESVVFETTQTNFTEDKFFSINLGDANYLPSTGHYYFYVQSTGITWTQARTAAEAQDYFGLQGYLATLTTEEEADLAGSQSSGTGWIGASDSEQEGTWKWVTGPEAGTVFWIGEVGGMPQNGLYTFWNSGEPNNLGNENYAHITDPSVGILGSWNDLANTGSTDTNSPYHPQGYIVEFGGMPGDPDVNLSVSTRIETPKSILTGSESCDVSQVTLNVETNTDTVFWYESETATTPIYTGTSYTVTLTETTTFWVLPTFSGCTDGARIPITGTIFGLPETQDISIVQCGSTSGITIFNLFESNQEVAAGIVQNRQVRYYTDSNLTDEITTSAYTNISNPQTVYAKVTDLTTGCENTAEVTLEVASNAVNNAMLSECDTIEELGVTQFDLSEADAQILNGLPTDVTVVYYETLDDALLLSNPLGTQFTNTIPYSQTIFARLEQNGDCYGIGEVTLTVLNLPAIATEETAYYCLNFFPQNITLESGITTDFNNYTFLWSTGEMTPEIHVNEIGTYTVEVTQIGACTKTKTITVEPSNIATITDIQIDDISDTNVVTVLVSGEGDYVYALNNPNGIYQESNVFQNVPAGFHTVYIKDVKNNCGIVSEEIAVIGYPKFFTPNNDGVNDTWQLKGISSVFQANSQVFIYDRYGKLLRILINSEDAWNGTINGTRMPSSDYWFSVQLQDGRTFTGHFTLKR